MLDERRSRTNRLGVPKNFPIIVIAFLSSCLGYAEIRNVMERRLLLLWLLGSLPQFSNAQLPFYEEHFDQTSFPPGWTTDDHSANPADLHVLWEVCQDPSTCPPGTDDDLPAQFDPDYFNAPTYAGGYVFVDSDKANIPTGAADHISVLTSAAINCSAQSQVFARFYSVIGTYQSPAFEGAVLLVSSDSMIWTEFKLYPDLGLPTQKAQFSTNPAPVTVDISSVAAGEATVYLRWQWTGKAERSWCIDDLELFSEAPHLYRAVWGHLPGQGDFNGGMNGWTVQTITPPGQGWTWEPSGYIGNALTAPDGYYIASPTACNGAMVINTDYYYTGGEEVPPFPPPLYISELISPTIDLSAVGQKLSLRFSQIVSPAQKAPSYPYQTSFAYSIDDGQTWSPLEDANPYVPINSDWTPSVRVFPLPDSLAGKPEVRLKFVHAGTVFGWAIDDVVIYARERHNLDLKRNFYAIAPNALTPATMIDSVHFMVDIENIGQDTQTQVMCFIRIVDEGSGSAVFLDSLSLGSLAPNALAENQIFARAFLPEAEPADYRATYYLRADSTDQFPANDTLHWSFSITDSLLAKESQATSAFKPVGISNYTYGNCYYIPPNTDLGACKLTFGGRTQNPSDLGGLKVNLILYHWVNGDVNGDLKANSDEIVQVATNEFTFEGDENFELVTQYINFDSSTVALAPDSYYFAVVRYEIQNGIDYFTYVNEDNDYQATFFLYDLLDKPRYFTMLDLENQDEYNIIGLGDSGFDQVPVVRLHLCMLSDDRELPYERADLILSPNPATDELRWELPQQGLRGPALLSIHDSNGRTLRRQRLSGPLPAAQWIDLRDLPNGQYFLEIRLTDGKLTKSFTILRP